MTIIVTGAAGFIGSNIVKGLNERGETNIIAVDNLTRAEKFNNLQDIFLNSLRKTKTPVTMFLVNGVMLQGQIAAFDLFCMLLQRDGMAQLVYKHAVSTIQPAHPLNLADETAGSDND